MFLKKVLKIKKIILDSALVFNKSIWDVQTFEQDVINIISILQTNMAFGLGNKSHEMLKNVIRTCTCNCLSIKICRLLNFH